MPKRAATVALIAVVVYAGLGVGFHIGWERALAACREERAARGEVVEPEVYGGALGLAFDMAFWPVYAAANIRLDGTPFSSPCTH